LALIAASVSFERRAAAQFLSGSATIARYQLEGRQRRHIGKYLAEINVVVEDPARCI
jgi:hypothetical protein